jgi:hypothetical protein
MKYPFLRLSVLCLLACAAIAQTPDTVIAGPYGVPRLVKNEGGQWSEPIKVYSNAEEIVYVPDITTPGWAQWHSQAFKDKGTYFTLVYTYLRKQRATVQETLYMNTRTQQATIARFLKPAIAVDVHTAKPAVITTTTNITKIVQDSIDHYNGPSIQSAIDAQKLAIAKMVACSVQPDSADCNLSDEAFAKKHTIYPRPPMKPLQGAVPGVNCGLSTNKSCYYPDTTKTSTASSDKQQTQ